MTASLSPLPNSANWYTRLIDNPVIRKELRGIMRGRRAFWLVTGYVTIISVFVALMYLVMAVQANYTPVDVQFRQNVGKLLFGTVVLMELLLISFIAPALTAGAITSEREHRTFDLLRTTLLSARSLVLGKLCVALVYLFLLMLAGLPIQSLAFLLGGVGLAEFLISSLLLGVTALFFAALGLFTSSVMRRTLASTVSAYGIIVVSYTLLGFGLVVSIPFSALTLSDKALEMILGIFLWAIICTNPLLTALISEVILIQDQSLWYTTSAFGSLNLPLPSPWIPFTILHTTLAIILILLSIHFVRRPSRT
ncbi:MAG: ABC transporter permease [Anaerolineales bacterium]|nr:ABC transporter permease [Anaerolineales bacterium]MCX7755663.1 ABC transporter permease [Anaerolineales bacterium]MDW8279467.1 ABC transporter permease subunit [Anaerolineales bacterium]